MSPGVRGIGVDAVELDRVRGILKRRGRSFAERILTTAELEEMGEPIRVPSLAGRFAAKEAVAKALGTGIRGFSFQDIEVLKDELGAPGVRLHRGARGRARELGIERIWISISHAQTVAVAVAVAEGS